MGYGRSCTNKLPVTTAAQVVRYTNHCEPYMGVVRTKIEGNPSRDFGAQSQ